MERSVGHYGAETIDMAESGSAKERVRPPSIDKVDYGHELPPELLLLMLECLRPSDRYTIKLDLENSSLATPS